MRNHTEMIVFHLKFISVLRIDSKKKQPISIPIMKRTIKQLKWVTHILISIQISFLRYDRANAGADIWTRVRQQFTFHPRFHFSGKLSTAQVFWVINWWDYFQTFNYDRSNFSREFQFLSLRFLKLNCACARLGYGVYGRNRLAKRVELDSQRVGEDLHGEYAAEG